VKDEHLSETIFDITRDVVKKALEIIPPTKDNIKNIAGEAMIGVTSAIRERKLKMLDVSNHAIYGITEGAKSFGRDARVMAQKAAKKSLENTKEK
jgi:hypothetical protein